jgi:hypothetical protein
MFTFLSRGAIRLIASARLRRITTALATVAGGLLAWAAAVPAASAASAAIIPVPGPGGAYGPSRPRQAAGSGLSRSPACPAGRSP